MGRKKPEDLEGSAGSIGGAMAQWPRRTVAWACRDARVGAADPHAVGALMNQEIGDLRGLADRAEAIDINPENVVAAADALEEVSAEELIRRTNEQYEAVYGDTGELMDQKCPYEESGMDMACWRCKVPSAVLDVLKERALPDGWSR